MSGIQIDGKWYRCYEMVVTHIDDNTVDLLPDQVTMCKMGHVAYCVKKK